MSALFFSNSYLLRALNSKKELCKGCPLKITFKMSHFYCKMFIVVGFHHGKEIIITQFKL